MPTLRYTRQSIGLLCLALIGLPLAACGVSSPGTNLGAAPTATATEDPRQDASPTPAGACKPRQTSPAPVPPPPAPTPIAPSGAKTYTNTSVGYTLTYPASWVVSDATTPDHGLLVLNYDPARYAPTGSHLAPPPYNAIQSDAVDNPSHLAPEAYNTAHPPYSRSQIGTLACWEPLSRAQVAGHDAFALVIWSAYPQQGGSSVYAPSVRYPIAAGSALLHIEESYSEGAKPSAALQQAISTLTFRN
ncbi:MAG TPA: hypothetical protein VFY89_07725 [Ktedonobacterales bacterium]